MNKPRNPSPARSQGTEPTRHKPRRSLSVTSQRSNGSGILSDLHKRNMESFELSPLIRKSILSDNTEVEEPRRKTWWKKLDENSRDLELLEENQIVEANNIIEELDIEVLSQEKKNYTMDLPESSDSESINSIVIPQRKLFTQKENLPTKKFGEIIGTRETLAKLHKPNTDKTINTGTRELFQNKQRSKPIFPAALLNISPDKTAADKTKEFTAVEPKSQVRNIFGNRSIKRKNIFTNFIESESEGEISEIQPKVFSFQKKLEARRRGSSSSRGIREASPTSSITTDIEMDDWKMLPSSTMVEHQLEILMTGQSPKRARLSKLTEIESEAGSNATQHANKSASSNMDKSRKSKTFTKEKAPDSESMINRNMSKLSQNEQEISGQNKGIQDKSRKSKTFTKEIAPEPQTVKNTSNVSQDENEEIFGRNKSSQDTEKSRKSKTFTKEKAPEPETVKNTSNVAQDKSEVIFDKNQVTNKSESKTIRQSKNNSHDSSQVIEEPVLIFFAMKSNSTTLAISPKNKHANMDSEGIPALAEQDDDEELNFTLQYENENNEDQKIEEMPEIQKKPTTETSKSNKSLPDKVIEESVVQESTQEKINLSVKAINKSQINDTSKVKENKNEMYVDNIELGHEQKREESQDQEKIMEVDEEIRVESEVENINKNEAKQDEIEDQNERSKDQGNTNQEVNEESGVENINENEVEQDEIEDQNESEKQDKIENASENEDEQDQSLVQNQSEDSENKNQDIEDENESQEQLDESEIEQNESQEIEDENEEENQVQNESQEIENENDEDLEQTESQEIENENEEDLEQTESQEVENENKEEDQEQNTRQEEIDQDTDKEQDESGIQDTEENESEDENQDESEAVADSDDENDNEPEHIQDDANESDNQDIESGQDENQEVDKEIETPNVSHDTSGRNRKKNESPEAILRDSNNHLDSFAVQGRNTSVRKTEMIQTMNIQPIFAPIRESTGFSDGDGIKNSSAEGSGWDSHRTTRKTLRQTYGREFTPRKSLRALVMEKSAKRQTQQNEIASVTAPFPQANSTEMPETSNRYDDGNEVDENQVSNHEVSLRTRQKTLEMYFQEVRKKNAENRLKIEEEVRNSLNAPPKFHTFKMPAKPLFARRTKPTPKPKQSNAKSALIFGELPEEFIEDMKYKPPKRFQPRNAPWITKHLYKYLETKLEPKYDYKARIRAERLVENIYNFASDLRRRDVATTDAVDVLKREMARLNIVQTHFDFYEFFHQFMPREVREKVIPDVVNNISLPRHGVFADIL